MAQFAAIIYEPLEARPDFTSPDAAAYMASYYEFGAFAGSAITGGAGLMGPDTATTFSVEGGIDGEVILSDGPFAETKEFIGGFYVFECEDLDAAIALARRIPAVWRDGGHIEVRPCIPM